MRKALILILIFFILALLQSSFLVFFSFKGRLLNLIIVLVVIINLAEDPKSKLGIFASLLGGFFLDLLSAGYFGQNMLMLSLISIFIKQFMKKYFHLSSPLKI